MSKLVTLDSDEFSALITELKNVINAQLPLLLNLSAAASNVSNVSKASNFSNVSNVSNVSNINAQILQLAAPILANISTEIASVCIKAVMELVTIEIPSIAIPATIVNVINEVPNQVGIQISNLVLTFPLSTVEDDAKSIIGKIVTEVEDVAKIVEKDLVETVTDLEQDLAKVITDVETEVESKLSTKNSSKSLRSRLFRKKSP